MTLEHSHDKDEIEARIGTAHKQGHLRDMVYGAVDGTVTTFAIVAGVQGAGLPVSVVITLGVANVLADGFSMAASNYSGTKAELDDRRRLWMVEEKHILQEPEGEREELRQILRIKGLDGHVLEQATLQIASDRDKWICAMLTDEYGLSPTYPNPLKAALATFGAFLVAGSAPLVPYIAGVPRTFEMATLASGLVFFCIGAAKSKWSLSPWWKSGLETLLIGALAAGIAYGAGSFFHP